MNIIISEVVKNGYRKVLLDNIEIGVTDGEWDLPGGEFSIEFEIEFLKLLPDIQLKELFVRGLCSFRLPIETNKFEHLDWLDFDSSSLWFDYESICTVNIKPDFLKWNKSIELLTLVEHLESLTEIIPNNSSNILEEGLFIVFKIDSDKTINDEYLRILNFIDQEVKIVLEKNKTHTLENHLLNIFSFPTEIRQVCEQYLIYFSKFLEDLGINVTSKLDSQTQTTYFTIIPKDSNEALKNIRGLLDIYLNLPDAPDFEHISSSYSDLSLQQLIANVYHLKSQLALVNSMIQLKDATIESLKFTNHHKSLLIESKSLKNEEKTLDGLITINEFEGKGFNVNLPEIFRRLKRIFNK